MGRHSCCYKQKLRKGLWSPEEDEKLLRHITQYGHGCWSSVPKLAGLQRCGKSCRLRWINYLRPDLRRGSFTEEEERTIIEVHRIIGNRWAQIAKHLPGRTDNEVKNFWNSCIKKKLIAQGLDPNTHNLISHQKHSKHNRLDASNVAKNRVIASNSTSLAFSTDHTADGTISEGIPSCFELGNDVDVQTIEFGCAETKASQNHSVAPELSTQCLPLDSMTTCNSPVLLNIDPFDYMVDDKSIWSTTLGSFEQSARASQVFLPQDPSICGPISETSINSSGFEYGFGDYSSIIVPNSLYGDIGSAIEQLAWGHC